MNPVLMFLVTMLLSSSGAGTVQTVIKSGQDHHEVLINKYDCSAVQGFNYLHYVTNFYFHYKLYDEEIFNWFPCPLYLIDFVVDSWYI